MKKNNKICGGSWVLLAMLSYQINLYFYLSNIDPELAFAGRRAHCDFTSNRKNYNFLDFDWLKETPISTNSFAKLLTIF